MNKNPFILIVILLSIFILNMERLSQPRVNVYGWYGIISREILSNFEKETGIKVVYDVYDNNDSLEAKLLATNSGYDIVFPSFIPYAARQLNMGAYQKIDMKYVPNIKNISGSITDNYKKSGGDIDYLIPILWGTTGIAYDANVLSKIFPNEKIDSYDVLLNPEKIKKLAKYGVSFPEEYIDIFLQTNIYLNQGTLDNRRDIKSINQYIDHFKLVREYIKKFSSSTMINDLISGEVCIAIGSSDNAWRAMRSGKYVNKDIRYVIPKNAGILWVDCVGIPQKAPNKENAYKFLNYLLRPDVAAKITNYSGILLNIPESTNLYNKEITNDSEICPMDNDVISKLIMGTPNKNLSNTKYDKLATRAWSQIKMGIFTHIEADE